MNIDTCYVDIYDGYITKNVASIYDTLDDGATYFLKQEARLDFQKNLSDAQICRVASVQEHNIRVLFFLHHTATYKVLRIRKTNSHFWIRKYQIIQICISIFILGTFGLIVYLSIERETEDVYWTFFILIWVKRPLFLYSAHIGRDLED
ncbi:hypothetical protein ACJX0J_005928 [Zea mays]